MIHASSYKPKYFPFGGTGVPAEIDRLQDMRATPTLNRTKIQEIGREEIVDWKKGIPSVSLTLKQLEYGSIEFFQKLANVSSSKVEFTDFKTSQGDIAGYKTDDSGTFLSTIWYPNLRLSNFSFNIGDPEALIERNFTLVGEDEITLQNNNKYFIYKTTSPTDGTNQTITISDPVVVTDPDNSGKYIFKVIRVRAGVTTELTYGTDWTCNGSAITLVGTSYASDVIKYYYSASSYISGTEPFVENNTDLAGISADSVSIYLIDSGNYLHKLQSVSGDITFTRQDNKEIGSDSVVQRGVKETVTKLTLGRLLETWTIEEVLRGVSGLNFGKIDIRKYSDNLALLVLMYSDSTKTTFKMGYKFSGLSPTEGETSITVNDYVNRNVTLEGETGYISSNSSDF
jgi:hypothetical protein